MPKKMEEALRKQAKKKGVKDKDAYVYGAMRKAGWKPPKERKGGKRRAR